MNNERTVCKLLRISPKINFQNMIMKLKYFVPLYIKRFSYAASRFYEIN